MNAIEQALGGIVIEAKHLEQGFRGLQWVATALPRARLQSSEYTLSYLYADNGYIVASDMTRLHAFLTSKLTLDDGFYSVTKNTKTLAIITRVPQDKKFPDWRALLMDENLKTRHIYNCPCCHPDEIETISCIFSRITVNAAINLKMNLYINFDLFRSTVSCGEPMEARYDSKTKGIIFSNPDHLALLMPMGY